MDSMSLMLEQSQFFVENGNGFPYNRLQQNCDCCPYGYHIDLDFLQYVESLISNIPSSNPSDGELLRRDKRRSRLSKEFMLGLDINWDICNTVYPVQEVQFECEPDSPIVNKKDYKENFVYANIPNESHQHQHVNTNNSPPETKAFLHDCLDEVVNDFERTLERTKKKDKLIEETNPNSWKNFENEPQNDKFKFVTPTVGVSYNERNGHYEHYETPKRKQEYEPMVKKELLERYEVIQKRMHTTLERVQILENELKTVGELKEKVVKLENEKELLQIQLQEQNDKVRKLENIPPPPPIRTSSTNITAAAKNKAQFTPQRISPVSLESLGTRIRTSPQSTPDADFSAKIKTSPQRAPDSISKRDIGIMCTQNFRDANVSTNSTMLRSVGTNPSNTNGINDVLYDKKTINDLISSSINEYEINRKKKQFANQISIGTQMVMKSRPAQKSTQTDLEKKVHTVSKGVLAFPYTRDFGASFKPETRTIGSSDHRISDILCQKCLVTKRTVGCGPDEKNPLSLKQINSVIRSNTFSLGENEKLNITKKPASTQCEISFTDKSTQSFIDSKSIAIQNSPKYVSAYSQYVSDNKTKSLDTTDLLKLITRETNTDAQPIIETKNVVTISHTGSNTNTIRTKDNGINTEKIKTRESGFTTEKLKTYDYGTNTDIFNTREYGTNTLPTAIRKHSSSNTDEIHKRDIGCGELIKPHISIACADNYCDSCKDAIKNLAKNFTKILNDSMTTTEQSKIPRPTGLPSPSTTRKKFFRQNTYTVSSPTETKQENILSDINKTQSLKTLDSEKISASSKTTITTSTNEEKSSNSNLINNLQKDNLVSIRKETKYKTLVKEKDEVKNKIQDKSKQEVEPSTSKINQNDSKEDKKEFSDKPVNKMILNRIATATLEPREKNSPTKEMKAALKVINDSLRSSSKSQNIKNAADIVQKEWFQLSSSDKANPLDVEDYLDYFEEISNCLLKYMVNLSDANGNTAMHYAISHGNFDVVSILLDSKVCDVNQMNKAGYTCVMLVSLAKIKNSSHRIVVQRLFQMADVNIRAKKHSQTALMLAVSHGNLDMAEMLLHAGADINIQDEDGSSSLLCAAEHGRIDIVKLLLSQADCDSTIQDVDGSTAFKIAWQAGHRDIGLLLYVHEQMLRSKKSDQKSPILLKNKPPNPPSTPPAPTA